MGKVFTMVEFKIIMIEILSNFSFEPADKSGGEVEVVNPSPVLRPKGGLRVKVRRLPKES